MDNDGFKTVIPYEDNRWKKKLEEELFGWILIQNFDKNLRKVLVVWK